MRSLFLKIFLSFWIAQALFLVLAILVTVALRPAREISAVESSQSRFLSEAVAAYQAGGVEKVRDYLHNLCEDQHVHSVLFYEQRPLTRRSARPSCSETATS